MEPEFSLSKPNKGDLNWDKDMNDNMDKIETWTKGVSVNDLITSVPITPDDYFSKWNLFKSIGGITSPLEEWGFTNAALTEVPSKTYVDINTKTLTIYSISEFANRTWDVQQYQKGVYLLNSEDKSLILSKG